MPKEGSLMKAETREALPSSAEVAPGRETLQAIVVRPTMVAQVVTVVS